MSLTQNDLDCFYHFATAVLREEDADSLEDVVEKWRAEFSPEGNREEDEMAIAAAIRDMQTGDHGRDSRDSVQDLRAALETSQ